MDANALLEGDYIKAVELGNKLPANPTYEITAIDIERMPNIKKPGKETNKGVVSFKEIERGWVMNRTNVECLKALFGTETQGWVGKRVTLGTEPTKTGLGIRIVGSPDIDREVTAEWTPPRQRKQTKKMVPTGNASGQRRQDHRQDAPDPRAAFLAALPQIGLTADVVTEWLASIGLTPASADDYRAVYATLKPDGTRRAAVDAFIAGRVEGGGAQS